MKKYLFAGVGFLVAALAIGGGILLFNSLDNESVQKDTADVVRADDTVIIGIDPNYAPMEFRDDNADIIGYDVEMIDAAFKMMGKKYQLLPIVWADKTKLLNSGKIDYIWSGLSINDERKKIYELSNPYLASSQVIAVAKNSDIVEKSQLAGKIVGIETAGASKGAVETFSKNNPSGPVAEIKEAGVTSALLVGLLKGELDAVVGSNIVVDFFVANNSEQFRTIKLADNNGVGVGVKKGNKDKIQEINKILLELKKNGTEAKIHAKWFGK